MLKQAWERDFLTKEALVEVQNVIVDPRYGNEGYRDEIGEQIYVGESIALGNERIHYIGPKSEDTAELMQHYLKVAKKMLADSAVPDLVAAAVLSYLFNYLHPFSDGNGRIHRFLLHHILAKRRFGTDGVILPISAAILNRPQDYDRSLESFSRKLLPLMEFDLDDRLRMTVHRDTCDHYRYIDTTELVTVFYDFVRQTIHTELPDEVAHLRCHDDCRRRMRDIVDFPDRQAELFIKLCLQNAGRLSRNKRSLPEFQDLEEQDIADLEEVVRDSFKLDV